ncbi:MAG: hypothetical protein RMA76_24265 [Deltaproteobacteria bacterium]|jgi:demethoxyubiquinone hydroxylase (CLK1/Coq7/Cat5 family)
MTDDVKLDTRTVERHIAAGRLSRADYDKHLASLPDLAEEAEFVDYAQQFREEAQQEQAEAQAAEAGEAAPAAEGEAPAPAPNPGGSTLLG